MIKFLSKGLFRDSSRSLFPVIIITITVTVVIFTLGFMRGAMNTMFLDTAIIFSGYEKVVTKGYSEESGMLPNDLALVEITPLLDKLNELYPEYFWSPKITFSGLLDIPDNNNETLSQGPVIAMGIDFLSPKSRQVELWKFDKYIRTGRLPEKYDEALISTKLAEKLNVNIGQKITFIGTTMNNAFTTYNYMLVGTFNLMKGQTDRQMLLVDIKGAQEALDMQDSASEILGLTNNLFYNDANAISIRNDFNSQYFDSLDIYSPYMLALRDSGQMGTMVDFSSAALIVIGGIFLVIVMVVLWNMGLMNGLRRHGEIGLRLAIGESKGQVYRSMIYEAIIIGFTGTIIGTFFGINITYYFQKNGIDYTEAVESMNASSMVLPNIFYTQVTTDLYYIGFFPGLLATVLGTMLAGLAIYRREMSQLFKELES